MGIFVVTGRRVPTRRPTSRSGRASRAAASRGDVGMLRTMSVLAGWWSNKSDKSPHVGVSMLDAQRQLLN